MSGWMHLAFEVAKFLLKAGCITFIVVLLCNVRRPNGKRKKD